MGEFRGGGGDYGEAVERRSGGGGGGRGAGDVGDEGRGGVGEDVREEEALGLHHERDDDGPAGVGDVEREALNEGEEAVVGEEVCAGESETGEAFGVG